MSERRVSSGAMFVVDSTRFILFNEPSDRHRWENVVAFLHKGDVFIVIEPRVNYDWSLVVSASGTHFAYFDDVQTETFKVAP